MTVTLILKKIMPTKEAHPERIGKATLLMAFFGLVINFTYTIQQEGQDNQIKRL